MTATTTSAATSACTAAASDESIENGDFEQGLSPWSVDLVDVMSTHYGTAQPGAEGSCNAFNVRSMYHEFFPLPPSPFPFPSRYYQDTSSALPIFLLASVPTSP